MAYVRVLGGLAVLGGGCLAYAAAQSRHVGSCLDHISIYIVY